MPSVALHPPSATRNTISNDSNPLPPLLHTPAGLAILEIQGTLHYPHPTEDSAPTSIGRLVFPLYSRDQDENDTEWMKKVYLYVGQHQRLTGEVKKLDKALGVIGKRGDKDADGDASMTNGGTSGEELEVKAIVKYKILFKGRPEPVSNESRV